MTARSRPAAASGRLHLKAGLVERGRQPGVNPTRMKRHAHRIRLVTPELNRSNFGPTGSAQPSEALQLYQPPRALRRRRSVGLRVMDIPVRVRQTRMQLVRWESLRDSNVRRDPLASNKRFACLHGIAVLFIQLFGVGLVMFRFS